MRSFSRRRICAQRFLESIVRRPGRIEVTLIARHDDVRIPRACGHLDEQIRADGAPRANVRSNSFEQSPGKIRVRERTAGKAVHVAVYELVFGTLALLPSGKFGLGQRFVRKRSH